jgi:hypothetical protein
MKIILDIPDGVICAFLTGVQVVEDGRMNMFCFQLDGEDLKDGMETKLPRERKNDD